MSVGATTTRKATEARRVGSYGEYRTKRLILEIYGELAEAIATGRPHQTSRRRRPSGITVVVGG